MERDDDGGTFGGGLSLLLDAWQKGELWFLNVKLRGRYIQEILIFMEILCMRRALAD